MSSCSQCNYCRVLINDVIFIYPLTMNPSNPFSNTCTNFQINTLFLCLFTILSCKFTTQLMKNPNNKWKPRNLSLWSCVCVCVCVYVFLQTSVKEYIVYLAQVYILPLKPWNCSHCYQATVGNTGSQCKEPIDIERAAWRSYRHPQRCPPVSRHVRTQIILTDSITKKLVHTASTWTV